MNPLANQDAIFAPEDKKKTFQSTSTTVVERPINSATKIIKCTFCNGSHLQKNCNISKVKKRIALFQQERCFKCLKERGHNHHQCREDGCNRCHSEQDSLICLCETYLPPSNTILRKFPCPLPYYAGTTAGSSSTNFKLLTNREASESNIEPARSTNKSTDTPNQTSLYHHQPLIISLYHLNPTRINAPYYTTGQINSTLPPFAIYLPTLKVYSSNLQTNQSCITRILLDNGSTTSFISEAIVNTLSLPRLPIEPIIVNAFAGLARITIGYETRLMLQSITNPTVQSEVSVFVMSGILMGQLPAATEEHLEIARQQRVTLSDYATQNEFSTIDILIGQDLFNDHFLLNLQESRKFGLGMAFVETRFGWTLQGSPGGRVIQNLYLNGAHRDTAS